MHYFSRRNIVLALQISTSLLPQSASADEFSTTECHCFALHGKIPNNHGLLTMSYYHEASNTTGYLDTPCDKEGCQTRRKGYDMYCGTAHKDPGGRTTDPGVFPNATGFCFNRVRDRKPVGDKVLFPFKPKPKKMPEPLRSVDEEQTEDEEDPDFEIEEEDLDDDADWDAGEEGDVELTSAPFTGGSDNWQVLSKKKTKRLNDKGICFDICLNYYGEYAAIPKCGWKHKCRKTTWRKLPNAPALESGAGGNGTDVDDEEEE